MKKSKKHANKKKALHIIGLCIGLIALYFSVRNIDLTRLKNAIESIDALWVWLIVIGNFGVIALKTLRWQIVFKPVKKIGFWMLFKILTIGYMVNNILPARAGDIFRIHLIGKGSDISRITTASTDIADRIIEALSFILIAALLVLFIDVPVWVESGVLITVIITITLYIASLFYSTRKLIRPFWKKLQDGVETLKRPRYLFLSLTASVFSWTLQGLLIYMTQLAFGIEVPLYGIILVLVAVNLAILIPGAPSHIGTFEFACVLAYTSLGVDKTLGLLIGSTYHLLQIIPVTIAGGALYLSVYLRGAHERDSIEAREDPC